MLGCLLVQPGGMSVAPEGARVTKGYSVVLTVSYRDLLVDDSVARELLPRMEVTTDDAVVTSGGGLPVGALSVSMGSLPE